MKKWMWGLILLLLLTAGAALWILRNASEPEMPQGVILDSKPMIGADLFFMEEGHTFLSLAALQEIVQLPLETDTENRRIWIDSTAVAQNYEDSEVTRLIRSGAGRINLPVKQYNGGWFVDLERFGEWLGLQYRLSGNHQVLLVDRPDEPLVYGAVVGSSVKLRRQPGNGAAWPGSLRDGDRVRIFDPVKRQYLVRTEDGLVGYLNADQVVPYSRPEVPVKLFSQARTDSPVYHALSIAWDYVDKYSSNPDMRKAEKIEGLDVLCPTWFSLNAEGIVTNDASVAYVRGAHQKGYDVWGTFRNGFEPERTHRMLSDDALRQRVVASVAFYVSYYELDGINLDFENVQVRDKALLVQFVSQLHKTLARQGVLLSIDATVPGGSPQWSGFLDRAALAMKVDYLILMAYDQHYAESEEAGSVASLSWTEKGIQETLKLVPPQKLVLGVPLYTRLWTLGADKNVLESKALSMKDQMGYLKGRNPQMSWDEAAGQIRADISLSDGGQVLWLEDENSMKARLKLIEKYHLAGVAAWRKGFEQPEYWEWVRRWVKSLPAGTDTGVE